MVIRERYPAGVPCWMEITPPDPQAAVAFYGSLFGWQFESRGPVGDYHVGQLDGYDVAAVGPSEGAGPSAPGGRDEPEAAWTMYVAVDDLDEAVGRVRAAGGQVRHVFDLVPGLGRSAACTDPAGAAFSLWQSDGRAGAQVVNGDGSWNFNELTTTDPDGATAFYGAVLGWQAVPVDFGMGAAAMWCRPGYGEFLASIDPEIRQRHAEAGAPDDFWDAVGWMAAAEAGPASWEVTFAVDDADGTVQLAEKLGATVVSPPVDAGVVRMAVLRDPQGARFTVSHYQPG